MPEELETIDMVKCSRCKQQWVEEIYLVCDSCAKAFQCDLAVADLVSSIDKLRQMEADRLLTRIDIIVNSNSLLNKLIRKVKPKL